MHTHPYEYTHVNPTSEIDEITTDASLSTDTSYTIERIKHVKS
ncbi:hypothetical protein BAE44_0000273 [Dichanthelium oligosanthes]|uniref:Uncharacterized protein n=1 Tax=Dichanthelium oligosanthes TaxID=888268 RepID=A0A1E5WNH4_9POAL|nr:hypothetical protein BAE44_0000273 [Dichanthelium oligosanthes]